MILYMCDRAGTDPATRERERMAMGMLFLLECFIYKGYVVELYLLNDW